jgi:molybdate transport system substrate-binding protein
MRHLIPLLAAYSLLVALPAGAAAEGPRVAVAASAYEAVEAIAAAYTQAGHPAPRLVSGATGKFYHQLKSGAPFDLLFAADAAYTRKLEAEMKTAARKRYARGRLVLWAPKNGIDVSQGLSSLQTVKHVAIANPALAPYGKAAVLALQKARLFDALAPRLVMGESAGQAAQFVTTGAAEAGLLPLSLALSPKLAGKGKHWLVPANTHQPLDAEVVLLKNGHDPTAKTFLDYATSKAAAPVWRRFGFEP